MAAAKELPPDELPRLLGDLEEVRATAQARLMTPSAPAVDDDWVDVEEAAALLSHSVSYLYHHKFPFEKRVSGKLLYSRAGIRRYKNMAKVS